MLDQTQSGAEAIVRSLASAEKSLRLYPPTSDIPRTAVQTAVVAIDARITTQGPLSIAIARSGFSADGSAVPGAADLAEELRSHGVAELMIAAPCSTDELLTFLQLAMHSPEEVRMQGGFSAMLGSGGVTGLRVSEVQLIVADDSALYAEGDMDDFLKSLSTDPEKLARWMAAAASGDLGSFGEGLVEIAMASGADGLQTFVQSLAGAFSSSDAHTKDALMEISMEQGRVRSIAATMFGVLGPNEIAASVLGGSFGRNMLLLSNALTNLPLERCTAEVREQVQAMLPGSGHSEKEVTFLNHMMDVRSRTTPEPSLAEKDATYRAVAQATAVSPDDVNRARDAVVGAAPALSAAGVRTMLILLDQQQDAELYVSAATNLANVVPRLVDGGQVALAGTVVEALAAREGRAQQTWPALAERIQAALTDACGPRAMESLLRATVADRSAAAHAKEIVRHGGEPAALALTQAAINAGGDALCIAEGLLGRRLLDMLNALAPQLPVPRIAGVVARLAAENDMRAQNTVTALAGRADAAIRREVVAGLTVAAASSANGDGRVVVNHLTRLLSDADVSIASAAVKALSHDGLTGAPEALSARLETLDIDNNDFPLAREIIGALSRHDSPAAESALTRLVARKSLMKRGHFLEINELAQRALDVRRQRGGAR